MRPGLVVTLIMFVVIAGTTVVGAQSRMHVTGQRGRFDGESADRQLRRRKSYWQ